ncbi:MAG: PhzF family phenazine biosynthesis protein [Rhodospirillales bacterium]|nr:PhzF family phenazine biosynthesis protein [Rhodospirillales bacterium]
MIAAERGRRYATVDVFTDTPFGGNPLAVVIDAEGLDAATMQRIAAEFGYSETTFVLPPADAANTARVRIFTPKAELPFAGHPNVGTAYVLAAHGEVFGVEVGEQVVFEEGAGLVPVDLVWEEGMLVGARLTAPQLPQLAGEVPVEAVAACSGLPGSAIIVARHGPRVVSCGMPFVIAEVTDRHALAAASPQIAAFDQLTRFGSGALLLYTVLSDGSEADIEARMFAPLLGVVEDPATGSAAAALAGLRAVLAAEGDLESVIRIAQGAAVGRPSLLFAEADKRDGSVIAVRVGGYCVPVMAGELLDI